MPKTRKEILYEAAMALVEADPAHATRVLYHTRKGELRYGKESWFGKASPRRRGYLVGWVRWSRPAPDQDPSPKIVEA